MLTLQLVYTATMFVYIACHQCYISMHARLYYCYYYYLSAHVQRTKQALGIAPHEALFKKHTQKTRQKIVDRIYT